VVLPDEAVEALWRHAEQAPGAGITVDLVAREVRADATTWTFTLDDHIRWRLLEGLDDIGLTLRHADDIAAFEARRPSWRPVVV